MLENFSDADARRVILRAIRTLAIGAILASAAVLWKLGWRSALMLLVGAVISGSGLWEWLRLMSSLMARMSTEDSATPPRPMAWVLIGFFLRLGLAFVLLYVSLKFLNGSVYALVGGIALGVLALTIEGLRLVKAWTV